jgi:hypothetical protein
MYYSDCKFVHGRRPLCFFSCSRLVLRATSVDCKRALSLGTIIQLDMTHLLSRKERIALEFAGLDDDG